jgi:hypothetical protein
MRPRDERNSRMCGASGEFSRCRGDSVYFADERDPEQGSKVSQRLVLSPSFRRCASANRNRQAFRLA